MWKAILLTLLLIAAAGLAGLALPGGVVAAETTCSARKLELIGAACSRLLRHEARFVFSEEVPVATRRLERTRSQFATSWTQVEAEEPATCAAQTAPVEVAWTLLRQRVRGAVAQAETRTCQRRLARTLARACRAWAGLELRDTDSSTDFMHRRERRLDRRVETLWRRADCGGLDEAAAGDEAAHAGLV